MCENRVFQQFMAMVTVVGSNVTNFPYTARIIKFLLMTENVWKAKMVYCLPLTNSGRQCVKSGLVSHHTVVT